MYYQEIVDKLKDLFNKKIIMFNLCPFPENLVKEEIIENYEDEINFNNISSFEYLFNELSKKRNYIYSHYQEPHIKFDYNIDAANKLIIKVKNYREETDEEFAFRIERENIERNATMFFSGKQNRITLENIGSLITILNEELYKLHTEDEFKEIRELISELNNYRKLL